MTESSVALVAEVQSPAPPVRFEMTKGAKFGLAAFPVPTGHEKSAATNFAHLRDASKAYETITRRSAERTWLTNSCQDTNRTICLTYSPGAGGLSSSRWNGMGIWGATTAIGLLCLVSSTSINQSRAEVSRPIGSASNQSFASELIDRAQLAAKLTLEELAPLVGVSRRSLQNWRTGDPISARKEHRLREALSALENLPASDPEQRRQILFARRAGGLRVYDLFSEGRFAAAAHLAEMSPEVVADESLALNFWNRGPSLAVRVDLIDAPASGTEGRVNLRRSARFKR